MSVRAGTVLLEVMTTAVLLAMLCAIAATLLHSESLVVRNTSDHIATDEALNSARAIVAADLRNTTSNDVRAIGRDSVALRVFRGRGVVCAVGPESIRLRYRGLREPNADKDSILSVRVERTDALILSSAHAPSCSFADGEDEITVQTSLPLAAGDVVLFFESGTYYLATNALRYRRGLEGKQPLTDEQIDDKASLFGREDNRGMHLFIKGKGPAKGSAVTDFRTRFLNAP